MNQFMKRRYWVEMELWTLLLPVILIAGTRWSEAFVEVRYSTTNDPVLSPKRPTGNCRCRINFTEADCQYCGLDQVPDCVPNSTQHLIMRGNNLGVLRNKSLGRFYALETLDISHCNISKLEELAFKDLENLLVLDMSNNVLPLSPNTYSVHVFSPLEKLKELYLGNNTRHDVHDSTLDYPDQALATLTSLEQLGMDGLKNRSFGPGFSKMTSLRVLDVSGVNGTCRIESLLKHTFVHLGGLTHLILEECHINHTETETFSPLQNLIVLSLSGNSDLTFKRFANVSIGLRAKGLKVLKLDRIDTRCIFCKTLCPAYVGHLRNLSHLEELHLSGNNLRYISQNITCIIPPSLKRLFIRDNDVFVESNLLHIAERSNLTEIDAGCKDPRSIGKNSDRSYTSEDKCSRKEKCPPFDWNELGCGGFPNDDDIKPWGPSPIERLDLSWQRSLINIYGYNFNASRLKYLDVTGMILPHWIGPVAGMEDLRVLNMSNNFAHTISDSFFINFKDLEVINVSWNSFYHLFEIPVNQSAFFPLKKLRVVDLSYNQLTRFPNKTTELFRVVEELYLTGNKLVTDWLDVDFSLLHNLRILDLSRNSLTTIREDVCHSLDRLAHSRRSHKGTLRADDSFGQNIDVELRFQGNPIQCSCENLGFMSWLLTTDVHLPGIKTDYHCTLPSGKVVHYNSTQEWLHRFREGCQKQVGTALGCLGSVLLTVALVLFGVIYRYRWHLRYLYYSTRNRVTQQEADEESDRFPFDAFISFADEDEGFVRDELMPRLERQEGLRLCIHSRDFIPGRSVISSAVEAVQRSRRTLCLVSRNFLDSYWCRYEMQMAKMESLHTGRDVVVMVLYEHIRACSLPQEVLFYIRSESYVEYPRDPRCVQFFWDNLVRALKRRR